MISRLDMSLGPLLSELKSQLNPKNDGSLLKITLDGHHIETFFEIGFLLVSQAEKIQSISLSGCRLRSLNKMPFMPFLRELDLSNNDLSDFSEISSSKFPSLISLDISNNKEIKKISQLEFLIDCHRIKNLRIEGCGIQLNSEVLTKIRRWLPQDAIICFSDEKEKGKNILHVKPKFKFMNHLS